MRTGVKEEIKAERTVACGTQVVGKGNYLQDKHRCDRTFGILMLPGEFRVADDHPRSSLVISTATWRKMVKSRS